MFDYKGETCPYCEKVFHAGDDISVCPECGTPHHKECYAEEGRCANAPRHAEGFDWQTEHAAASAKNVAVICPHCGRAVPGGSKFCNFCGTSFEHDTPAAFADREETNQVSLIFGSRDEAENDSNKINGKEFDGIPVADWLKYIGRNAGRYLGFFNYQDRTGRKTSFTLSAALFPSIYFLYRKMWWWAAAAAAFSFAFYLPTIALYLNSAGFNLGFDPNFLQTAETYLSYVSLGVSLLWGMFAMYFYRHSAARRIRRIKSHSDSEQAYQLRLARVSGPSLLAAIMPFAFLLFGMMILNLLGLNILSI